MKLNLFFIIAMTLVLIVPGGVFANHTGPATNGDDFLIGHADKKDRINGKGGDDVILGESFAEILANTGLADNLRGAGGNDELVGGPGDDALNGAGDDDYLVGDTGFDEVDGGMDNDFMFGGIDDDTLDGGTGDDVMFGNEGDDEMKGGSGDDDLIGGPGDDNVSGNADDDNLDGGLGDDTLFLGEGNDNAFGDRGNDFLVGNLLAGVNSFNCGEDDEGPNGIGILEGDVAWWDGGDGAQIAGTETPEDPLDDLFADDVLPINCENVFNLASLGDDPPPPGGAPPGGSPPPPPTPTDTAIEDLKAIIDGLGKDINKNEAKKLKVTLDDAVDLFNGNQPANACLKLVEFETQVLGIPNNKLTQDAEDDILFDLPASLNTAVTGTNAVKGC